VVFERKDLGSNIFTAQRLPNGNLLYGLYTGVLIELDRTGKEVKKFSIHRPYGLTSVQVLPGGRYLIPDASNNRVVEIDSTGKVVWQVSTPQATCAAVLPGGNLLVGSHATSMVREIDRKGKVLWEHKAEGQIFRVRVR
jgi:outer membrane protein assembly factor BamB